MNFQTHPLGKSSSRSTHPNFNPANATSAKWKMPDFDLVRGLFFDPKWIHSKYYYDEEGYRLFDLLNETPESYALRSEMEIIEKNQPELAALVSAAGGLIEITADSQQKTKSILESINSPLNYAVVDGSVERIQDCLRPLRSRFSNFKFEEAVTDFTKPLAEKMRTRGLVYLHGTTLGNCDKKSAAVLLNQLFPLTTPQGGLLVGFDMQKSKKLMESACNDRFGVTAEFNLHLLKRINAEFQTELAEATFRHLAFYNQEQGRIEMHIRSTQAQSIMIMGRKVQFREGETIHTGNAYKYTFEEILALAEQADLKMNRAWTDDREYFSLVHFSRNA